MGERYLLPWVQKNSLAIVTLVQKKSLVPSWKEGKTSIYQCPTRYQRELLLSLANFSDYFLRPGNYLMEKHELVPERYRMTDTTHWTCSPVLLHFCFVLRLFAQTILIENWMQLNSQSADMSAQKSGIPPELALVVSPFSLEEVLWAKDNILHDILVLDQQYILTISLFCCNRINL